MGTTLREKDKGIKKSISTYSVLLLPAVFVGLGLLAFQTYSYFSGKTLKDINFDIGLLWSAENNSQLNEPIQPEDIVIRVVPQAKNMAAVVSPVAFIDINNYARGVKPKQANITDNDKLLKHKYAVFGSDQMPLERIEHIPIEQVYANNLVMKYMNQIEKNYLINPYLKPEKGKWFIGYSFAPSINYRSFEYQITEINGVAVSGNRRYTYGMTETFRNRSDKSISSYYVGVDFGLIFNSDWELSGGLYYSTYGESLSVTRVPENDINAQDAKFYGQAPMYYSPENSEKPVTFSFYNRYSYVEFPVLLSYRLTSRNMVDFSVQAGLYAQMLDHANALIYDFDTDYYYWLPRANYEIYRKYGMGTTAGFTASRFIGKNLEVLINPQLKMNMMSTFGKLYPISQKQYATGLRLGIKHHILQ